ncbi:hypothetical protein DIPPA_08709 [Diplonema papillatum]|nr:hypothetical protein DIPPA_08709 [Diplonema papillatum]
MQHRNVGALLLAVWTVLSGLSVGFFSRSRTAGAEVSVQTPRLESSGFDDTATKLASNLQGNDRQDSLIKGESAHSIGSREQDRREQKEREDAGIVLGNVGSLARVASGIKKPGRPGGDEVAENDEGTGVGGPAGRRDQARFVGRTQQRRTRDAILSRVRQKSQESNADASDFHACAASIRALVLKATDGLHGAAAHATDVLGLQFFRTQSHAPDDIHALLCPPPQKILGSCPGSTAAGVAARFGVPPCAEPPPRPPCEKRRRLEVTRKAWNLGDRDKGQGPWALTVPRGGAARPGAEKGGFRLRVVGGGGAPETRLVFVRAALQRELALGDAGVGLGGRGAFAVAATSVLEVVWALDLCSLYGTSSSLGSNPVNAPPPWASCSVLSLFHDLHVDAAFTHVTEAHNALLLPVIHKSFDHLLLPETLSSIGFGLSGEAVSPDADFALVTAASCRVQQSLTVSLFIGAPAVDCAEMRRVYGAKRLELLFFAFSAGKAAAYLLADDRPQRRGVSRDSEDEDDVEEAALGEGEGEEAAADTTRAVSRHEGFSAITELAAKCAATESGRCFVTIVLVK